MLPASFSPELSIFTTHGLSNSVKSTYTGKKINKRETWLFAHVANLLESTDISKFIFKLWTTSRPFTLQFLNGCVTQQQALHS